MNEFTSDAKKAIGLFALAGYMSLHACAPIVLNEINRAISPKLQTKSQVEAIVEQEKKKHGFKEGIEVILNDKGINRALYENGRNIIMLDERDLTEATAKHETYHIIKGHPRGRYQKALYLLRNEPMASAYAMMSHMQTHWR